MTSQELNDRILQLISKVNQLKMDNTSIDGLQQTNEYNLLRIDRYVSDIQQLRNDKMSLQLELGQRGKEMLSAVKSLEKAEKVIERLVEQQKNMNRQSNASENQILTLKEKLQEVSNLLFQSEKVAQINKQYNSSEFIKLESENEKLKHQYHQLLSKNQQSQFRITDLENQLSEQRILLNDYKRQAEALEVDNKLLAKSSAAFHQIEKSDELDKASTETQVLQQIDKIDELEQQVTSLENDNDLLKEDNKRLNVENQCMREQLRKETEHMLSEQQEVEEIQEVEVDDFDDEDKEKVTKQDNKEITEDFDEQTGQLDEPSSRLEEAQETISTKQTSQSSQKQAILSDSNINQEQIKIEKVQEDDLINMDITYYYQVSQQYGNISIQDQFQPTSYSPVFYYSYSTQYGENIYSPVFYYEYQTQYNVD
ncbi:hypothetical protein SS50377_25796 [Spironucleus salmonicida]|uniref:Uncharacterized protein n=1 Tax=Spironucleus salmonicida TaxID=348837 RepID=V6LVG9_9EUKA|nr:hypothetical protein SS50377_25796 [Spironucleus salmonicida]|eukprot:EST48228.1 Hypothetical protein SS50377_11570 [Spironucleus salmonicida]